MSKSEAKILLLKGIVMLIIGFYLTNPGVPPDESDLIVNEGKAMLQEMEETSDSSLISDSVEWFKAHLDLAGTIAKIIAIIEIIGACILFLIPEKKKSKEATS